MSETTCPVCGIAVEIMSSDEGTSYYKPIEDSALLGTNSDMCLVINAPDDVARLIAESRNLLPKLLATLDAERERANKATALLYGLTPGGSELHNDPERCAEWVAEQLERRSRALVEAKAAQRGATTHEATKGEGNG